MKRAYILLQHIQDVHKLHMDVLLNIIKEDQYLALEEQLMDSGYLNVSVATYRPDIFKKFLVKRLKGKQCE